MSNFIEINLKFLKLPKKYKIYTPIILKKYKIWVPGLKSGPDPDPDPNLLHPGRVRSLQYPDPARGFAIPNPKVDEYALVLLVQLILCEEDCLEVKHHFLLS